MNILTTRHIGYDWSFLLPPRHTPYSFPHPQTYRPAGSEGVLYRRGPAHPRTLLQLPATVPTASPCAALCPGGLPCPCPGQHAHQRVVTGREGGLLGITLDDRFSENGRTGKACDYKISPASWPGSPQSQSRSAAGRDGLRVLV